MGWLGKTLLAWVAALSITTWANAETPKDIEGNNTPIALTSEQIKAGCKVQLDCAVINLETAQALQTVIPKPIEHTPGQFQEWFSKAEYWIDKPFTEENVAAEFLAVLEFINSKYEVQVGQWEREFRILAPNDDEADVLNRFIESIPDGDIKPLPLANALTWLIALSKYSEIDISKISDEDMTKLVANLFAVQSVLSPEEARDKWYYKVLPVWTIYEWQEITDPNRTLAAYPIEGDLVRTLSDYGIELPVQLIEELKVVYNNFTTHWNENTISNFNTLKSWTQIAILQAFSWVDWSTNPDIDNPFAEFYANAQRTDKERQIAEIETQIKTLEAKVDNLPEDEAELIFAQLDNLTEIQIKLLNEISIITNSEIARHNQLQLASRERQEEQEIAIRQQLVDIRGMLVKTSF